MLGCCRTQDWVQVESCGGADMFVTSVLLTVLMILTFPLPLLAVYTFVDVGSDATQTGFWPTGIVVSTLKLVALTAVTSLDSEFAV